MAKILLIDDDELVRQSLEIALVENGHDVTTANDGKEGLDIYNSTSFDLIITDLIMPETEGMEVVMTLNNDENDTKVLVISGGGHTSPDVYLDTAKHLGAHETLAKPFSASELVITVDRLLAA